MSDKLSHALTTIARSLAQKKIDEIAAHKTNNDPRFGSTSLEAETALQLEALNKSWNQSVEKMSKGRVALQASLAQLPKEERDPLERELQAAMKTLDNLKNAPPQDNSTSLQSQLSLNNSTLLFIYKVGHQCFKNFQYKEAFGLFLTLTLLNSKVIDYWLALGTTQRELHLDKGALYSFSLISLLDPSHTLSRIHCIEIYTNLRRKEDALAELEALKEIVDQQGLNNLNAKIAEFQSKIDKISSHSSTSIQ